VNYTPYRAVRFDLEGNAVEVLDRAYRIGDVSLSIGKRPISSSEQIGTLLLQHLDDERLGHASLKPKSPDLD